MGGCLYYLLRWNGISVFKQPASKYHCFRDCRRYSKRKLLLLLPLLLLALLLLPFRKELQSRAYTWYCNRVRTRKIECDNTDLARCYREMKLDLRKSTDTGDANAESLVNIEIFFREFFTGRACHPESSKILLCFLLCFEFANFLLLTK